MLSSRPDPSTVRVGGDFSQGIDTVFRWVPTAPDGGQWYMASALNGVLTMEPSDSSAANNDELYIASAMSPFLFKAQRPLYASCRLQFVEAAANQANVIFGVMSAVAANSLIDDAGGVRASGSVCVIYKVDTGDKWRAQVRDTFGFKDAVSDATAGVLASTDTVDGVVTTTTPWQTLEIFVDDPRPPYTVTDRLLLATFRLNGVPLFAAPLEISPLSATQMQLVIGIKNGTTTMETLKMDWLYAQQGRD